ncbi:hypothetical protein Bbelb_300590 [Branchiostoma belcheri]|nr:hypothetical protein Bbelb_300590 [Branchiostoma belcheri]
MRPDGATAHSVNKLPCSPTLPFTRKSGPTVPSKGKVSNGSCLQLADDSSTRRAGMIKADLERNRQLAASTQPETVRNSRCCAAGEDGCPNRPGGQPENTPYQKSALIGDDALKNSQA